MDKKVHLLSRLEFFQERFKLLQRVEKAHSSSAIKVVRFNQPDVLTIVHFILKSEFFG